MNHDNLKATHTFGDDRKVRPATKTITVSQGGALAFTFPKHSLTIVKLSVK